MKVYAAILALLFAGLYPAIAADPPAVVVRFGDLSKFSDLRMSILRTERDSASLADELARHLEHAATPRLPPGARLAVTITDVDMAGEYPPVSGSLSNDVRVIKDVYPPRIDLDFTLVSADGSVLRQGHRKLRDGGFLLGANPLTRDRLVHEKGLLDLWLRSELGPQR
jgi:hypothetical protein